MLAASLLAHAGQLELPRDWDHFADRNDLREAQSWGLLVRMVRRFSDFSASSLTSSTLVNDGRTLILRVRPPCDKLINEGVRRDLKAAGSLLGLKTDFEVIDEDAPLHSD